MSGRNNGGLQRTLYTKKGIRKKIYKKIQQKLFDMGVLKENIDEVIGLIAAGQMVVEDADLKKDISTLMDFDKDIKRLTEKCLRRAETANSDSQQLVDSQSGISFE